MLTAPRVTFDHQCWHGNCPQTWSPGLQETKLMTQRRSTGKIQTARALWYVEPGVAELRPEQLANPKPDEARVRTLFSGISRGTERLIFSGQVGASEWERMRAPLQAGQFPFPVKYGYCAVGVVDIGPSELLGRTVFCLHPHQDMFNAPVSMLVPIPDGIPAKRATLAANAETALNALWDAGAGPGDKIVIVGAGVVGLMVAGIAAQLPAADVTVVDVDPTRREIVERLGARFVPASKLDGSDADVDADIVVHTSVNQAGLNTAIRLAGFEGTIVELSWYGDKLVTVDLGGPFHSKRLKLVSSQVGHVSAGRRPRWSYRRRMEAAIRLLANSALDALVTVELAFADTPAELPRVLGPTAYGLAPVIRY
jgi:NADPH:quinone reductase-like Zn-dependent oxidoreductase